MRHYNLSFRAKKYPEQTVLSAQGIYTHPDREVSRTAMVSEIQNNLFSEKGHNYPVNVLFCTRIGV